MQLLERMESANIHLDSVFLLPNVKLSKKRSRKDQFAKHVPGLAAFQPNVIREHAVSSPSSDELRSILRGVPKIDTQGILPVSRNRWWLDIKNASQMHANPQPGATMDLDGEETEDEMPQVRVLYGYWSVYRVLTHTSARLKRHRYLYKTIISSARLLLRDQLLKPSSVKPRTLTMKLRLQMTTKTYYLLQHSGRRLDP